MQVTQQKEAMASTPRQAAKALRDGRMAFVWLDDADETIRQWKYEVT